MPPIDLAFSARGFSIDKNNIWANSVMIRNAGMANIISQVQVIVATESLTRF